MNLIIKDPSRNELTRIKNTEIISLCNNGEPCIQHVVEAINYDLRKNGLHNWQIPKTNADSILRTLEISHNRVYLTIPSLVSCCS